MSAHKTHMLSQLQWNGKKRTSTHHYLLTPLHVYIVDQSLISTRQHASNALIRTEKSRVDLYYTVVNKFPPLSIKTNGNLKVLCT